MKYYKIQQKTSFNYINLEQYCSSYALCVVELFMRVMQENECREKFYWCCIGLMKIQLADAEVGKFCGGK